MPTYKLMYFNIRGRAEILRLIFAEAGVEYVDFRIDFADWPKYKPETPFGQLPVLMIDGKPLPQNETITRYLAKEFNLDGENPRQSANADMICETIKENFTKLPYMEKDEKKCAEGTKKVLEENIQPMLGKFEKILSENIQGGDGDFMVGKKISYADLKLLQAEMWLGDIKKLEVLDNYPNLKALIERVKKRPKIAAWLESHPGP